MASVRQGGPPPVHEMLVSVAMPAFALSPPHGQLTGHGVDGVYHAGRRVLARARLRVAGREPVTVQAGTVDAGLVRFTALVQAPAGGGPDPAIVVERSRDADGSERITLRSALDRVLRLPVELLLGADLAELGAIAAGRPGPEPSAAVQGAGLRWSAPVGWASVTAEPAPGDTLASAGVLRWLLDLGPGEERTIELRVRSSLMPRGGSGHRRPSAGGALAAEGASGGRCFSDARAEADDPRVERLFAAGVADLRALLLRDPAHPGGALFAAGVPWRARPVPAEALWAARMALPLGTGAAVGTLRALARTQHTAPGDGAGFIPGPLRDGGPGLPPVCTGTEATLAFPVVLAEARRWGLPDGEFAELLPAVERCLRWLRAAAGEDGYVPEPGSGRVLRAETQAHAHRAAVLGADLLEACGRPGAEEWRSWAGRLRTRFRADFWIDDRGGGRPVAVRTPGGPRPHLGGGAAHLLDTGLGDGGRPARGLLDPVRTGRLARLLGSPALDSGWGLRGLGADEPGFNPFGHRTGAVRVYETAVAVAGLAASGHEREAAALLDGLVRAAESFAYRLPEMYGGGRRTAGGAPVPHPAACRPSALSAASAVYLLATAAGIRPDVPAGLLAVRPLGSAPLGAFRLSGLAVAGEPLAVRVSGLGLGLVEAAAPSLRLGG